MKTSSHASLRRVQRGDVNNDRKLEDVWVQAIPCEVEGFDYHEARYDMVEQIVLTAKNDRIVTVLDASLPHVDVTTEVVTDDG